MFTERHRRHRDGKPFLYRTALQGCEEAIKNFQLNLEMKRTVQLQPVYLNVHKCN